MPLAYIPKSMAETARPLIISAIDFCAYPPGGISGPADPSSSSSDEKMTNHWVIYFVISPRKSIRVDPSLTGPNNSLDLIITSKDYSHTIHAVKTFTLSPATGLTVGRVIDHIIDSKHDRYQFSSGGQGCRYWVYSIGALLHSAGYTTNEAEVDRASQALQVVWDMDGNHMVDGQQTGMVQGTFY